MKSRSMLRPLVSACVLFLACASGYGCSDDDPQPPANQDHDPVSPSCLYFWGTCHEADVGLGTPAHECHELAEADVEADCAAQKTQCLATCQAALGDAGHD